MNNLARPPALACAMVLWLTVGLQLSAAGAIAPPTTGGIPVTGAFAVDVDASTGNTIEAGTLDLKLSEIGPATQDSTTDETREDTGVDTWEDLQHQEALGANDPVNNTLRLNNTASSLAADRVNITVSYAENDSSIGTSGNPDNTSRTIEIREFVYNGNDLVGTEVTDENRNDRIDLQDLTLGETKQNLSSLPGMSVGGHIDLTISFDGDRGLLSGVDGGDGLDIRIEIRVHGSSFVDRDASVDNTIRYADL